MLGVGTALAAADVLIRSISVLEAYVQWTAPRAGAGVRPTPSRSLRQIRSPREVSRRSHNPGGIVNPPRCRPGVGIVNYRHRSAGTNTALRYRQTRCEAGTQSLRSSHEDSGVAEEVINGSLRRIVHPPLQQGGEAAARPLLEFQAIAALGSGGRRTCSAAIIPHVH